MSRSILYVLTPGGSRRIIVKDLRPPVNGLTLHEEHLYVSEGGHPARISRFDTTKTGVFLPTARIGAIGWIR